ncbi:MAG: hypothetical protein IJR02_01395, partial [Bacteroidaceae bacterium]|nr:hypothetical protein [Bacteroidaceae bacterium]
FHCFSFLCQLLLVTKILVSSKGAVTLRQEADNSMAKVQRFFRRKGKWWRKGSPVKPCVGI